MGKTKPGSVGEIEAEILELVRNNMILRPKMPAAILADTIWLEEGQDALRPMAGILMRRHLERIINAERRKLRPKLETAPLFPDLELPVPRRIVTPEGKRPLLAKCTVTQIRAYVKSLNNRHRDKIAGLQAVVEIMERHTRQNRGLTAAAVAAIESEMGR